MKYTKQIKGSKLKEVLLQVALNPQFDALLSTTNPFIKTCFGISCGFYFCKITDRSV
jgi:hypothetical protein